MFIILKEFDERQTPDLSSDSIAAKLRLAAFQKIQDASVAVFGPPAVDGLGNAGGFKIMVQDRQTAGLQELQSAADTLANQGNQVPGLVGCLIRSVRIHRRCMWMWTVPNVNVWSCTERCVHDTPGVSGRLLHQ